jgi:glycosyltransferase involved in cell wall biosynthesis
MIKSARTNLFGLRVALVHDWFTGMGGREQVLQALSMLFIRADVHVLFYLPDELPEFVKNRQLFKSFLQKMPGLRHNYRYYLPLMPLAAEQLNLQNYDLVISSSHCAAIGVRTRAKAKHICYCHTPMRDCWGQKPGEVFGQAWPAWSRIAAGVVLRYLRHWDRKSAAGVDQFVANSTTVRQRIKRCYDRDAVVIHPPVACQRFNISKHIGEFYLIVGNLLDYKRIDLAMEACQRANRRLIIIGEGPEGRNLRAHNIKGVDFLGSQPDEVVADYMGRCLAFLMPGEEDFGITAVEAQAAGRPVIALAKGGVLDSVQPLGGADEPTGVLFEQANPAAMANAIAALEHNTEKFVPEKIRQHALNFDSSVFLQKFIDLLEQTLGQE